MFFRKLRQEFRSQSNKQLSKTKELEAKLSKLDFQVKKLSKNLVRLQNIKARPPSVYLGKNVVLTTLHSGHAMFVSSLDIGISPHLILTGRWEPWVEDVVLQCVSPGMNVLDIGANHGYYTILMAQAVGKNGQVYSCEANPMLADLMSKTIAVNGFNESVKLIRSAAFSHPTELEFNYDIQESGGGSIFSEKRSSSIKVQADSLDNLLPANIEIHFAKIDAEGAEPFILHGMTKILDNSPNISIVLEFSSKPLSNEQQPLEYLENFIQLGFNLRHISPVGLSGIQTPEEILELTKLNGLIYILLQRSTKRNSVN